MSDSYSTSAQPLLDPEQLAAQVEAISSVATRPEFVEILQEIHGAPESERVATAERLASIGELRSRGVDLPQGSRLTTRYFENPTAEVGGSLRLSTEVAAASEPISGVSASHTTICFSVGAIICVTVGHEEIYSGPPLS